MNKTRARRAAMITLDGAVSIRNAESSGATGRPQEEGAQSHMQDIAELERRITAAMERITKGVERLSDGAPASDAGEVARLTEALDEERMANAQLNERIRVLRDRLVAGAGQGETVSEATDAAHADLTAKLAAQEEELATLRRVLGEAGKEIAALRAARAAEAAELAEITAALEPLVEEAQNA